MWYLFPLNLQNSEQYLEKNYETTSKQEHML